MTAQHSKRLTRLRVGGGDRWRPDASVPTPAEVGGLTEIQTLTVQARTPAWRATPAGPWTQAEVAVTDEGVVAVTGEKLRWVGLATDLKFGMHVFEPGVVTLNAENLKVEVLVPDAFEFLEYLRQAQQAAERTVAVARAERSQWISYWAVVAVVIVLAGLGMVSGGVSETTFNWVMGALMVGAFGGAGLRIVASRRSAPEGAESAEVPEIPWLAYAVFSAVLIIGTGLVASEADLGSTGFGWAMTAAWVVVLGGAAFLRTRVLFGAIGAWIVGIVLAVLWFGGQTAALAWLSWEVANGRLRLGTVWMVGLVVWWILFFRQVAWLLGEGVWAIRRAIRARHGN